MLELGARVELEYPSRSLVGVEPAFLRRVMLVRSVRDLVKDPLTPAEFIRRPMVHRSRFLFRCLDVQKNAYRNVYEGAAREWRRDCPHRWGLFCGNQLMERVAGAWGNSEHDRLELRKLLEKWRFEDFAGWRIGVFVDDLRVIG